VTSNICNNKCREDPYKAESEFTYKVTGNNTAVIYSIGPDRIDNNGEFILEEDAIQYSINVIPWSFMPFRKYILHISGFDKKLEGDIVQIIENQ